MSDALARLAREHPDKVAVKAGTDVLTYQQLEKESDALAAGLSYKGTKEGDRVAISLGNCVPYILVRVLQTIDVEVSTDPIDA